MEAFTRLTAVAAPFDRPNTDTDQITPGRFLTRWDADWAKVLFHDLRFDGNGAERPDFILNQAPFRDAKILVANVNFACGSSRESAVHALVAYGFRAVIAPSFGDIFFNNASKNGLLTFVQDTDTCDRLRQQLHANPGAEMSIDLEAQRYSGPDGAHYAFKVDSFRKYVLLNGLDDIDLTMQYEDKIAAHETALRTEIPWLSTKA